jgi:hypothetical protein
MPFHIILILKESVNAEFQYKLLYTRTGPICTLLPNRGLCLVKLVGISWLRNFNASLFFCNEIPVNFGNVKLSTPRLLSIHI